MEMVKRYNEKQTDVLCFQCNKRYGIDCPGRKPNESTLCNPCFVVKMKQEEYEQAQHLLNCLNDGMFDEQKFYEFIDEQQ